MMALDNNLLWIRVTRKIFDEEVYSRATMNCKIFLPVDYRQYAE
jgi:hypothetical protein